MDPSLSGLSEGFSIDSSKSQMKLYKCDYCSFSTVHRQSVILHQVVHSPARPFRCDMCKYSAKRKHDLKKHRQCKHKLDCSDDYCQNLDSTSYQSEEAEGFSAVLGNQADNSYSEDAGYPYSPNSPVSESMYVTAGMPNIVNNEPGLEDDSCLVTSEEPVSSGHIIRNVMSPSLDYMPSSSFQYSDSAYEDDSSLRQFDHGETKYNTTSPSYSSATAQSSRNTETPPSEIRKNIYINLDSPNTLVASTVSTSSNGVDASTETKTMFHCKHCDIIFFDNAMYVMHTGLHGVMNPWMCRLCGQIFHEKYSFTSHFINQH